MNRTILHIDLDSFFASVEERENPELKGKPVVVCIYSGRTNDSGAVGTSNYLARSLGIKSGQSLFEAKKKATEDTVFLAARKELYLQVSKNIMSLISEFSEKIEQVSVDECFIDITKETQGDFFKAEQIAKKISEKILDVEKLTCSIGIAQNKLIAKIISSKFKPEKITVVLPDEEKEFLNGLLIKAIPGVGPKTRNLLKPFGIVTIKDLSKFPLQKLQDLIGENKGKKIHEFSNGVDNSPVQPREKQEYSNMASLKKDSNLFDEIKPVIGFLAEKVFSRIKEKNLFFKTVSITIVSNNYEFFTRSKTLDFEEQTLDSIISTAELLLKEFLTEKKQVIARRLGVTVSNLSKEKGKQKKLFEFS